MQYSKLDGDFSPVEIRGYNTKSNITCSDYAVIAINASRKIIAVGNEVYKYIDSIDSDTMVDISIYSSQ